MGLQVLLQILGHPLSVDKKPGVHVNENHLLRYTIQIFLFCVFYLFLIFFIRQKKKKNQFDLQPIDLPDFILCEQSVRVEEGVVGNVVATQIKEP